MFRRERARRRDTDHDAATDAATDAERAAFQSLDQLVPARLYPLVLALVFVTSLYGLYLLMPPGNEHDWVRTSQHLRYMTRLQDPYDNALGFQDDDLRARSLKPLEKPDGEAVKYSALPYSPWYGFYFGVIAYSTVRLVVALTFAAWITMVIGSGHPVVLLLALHPLFVFVWASGTIDFLTNGVGLWLIMMNRTGARRGVALMLVASRPHVLPLVLLLEGLRVLWERDWAALLTMSGIAAAGVALFSGWLDRFARIIDPLLPGIEVSSAGSGGGSFGNYPFSVYGAWGILAALGVTLLILLLMRRRLTEWRTLAILLGLVWTPYINPYSFAVLLVLFLRVPPRRVIVFWAVSLVTAPLFFVEFHRYERYGLLMFLLLTAALTTPQPDQTEEAIAAQHGVAPLPGVRALRQAGVARGEPVGA